MILTDGPGENGIDTIKDVFPNITYEDIKYIKNHIINCSDSTISGAGNFNCPYCTIKFKKESEGIDYVSGDEKIRYYHPRGLTEEDITDSDLIHYIEKKAKDISILQGKYSDGLVKDIKEKLNQLV